MRIEPLGDRAYILRDLDAPAYQLAVAINRCRLPGVVEAIASYDTVGLYIEEGFDPRSLDSIRPASDFEPRHHRIPVCYETGEDLEDVAAFLGLAPNEVATIHASVEYLCYAVGFCPGFGYLGELPQRLQGVARRPSPRTRVDAGSVGITGRQTAVYPLPRPGGWALIGRTPLTLVDVAEEYFPIQAGDTIRFEAIGADDYKGLEGERL